MLTTAENDLSLGKGKLGQSERKQSAEKEIKRRCDIGHHRRSDNHRGVAIASAPMDLLASEPSLRIACKARASVITDSMNRR